MGYSLPFLRGKECREQVGQKYLAAGGLALTLSLLPLLLPFFKKSVISAMDNIPKYPREHWGYAFYSLETLAIMLGKVVWHERSSAKLFH